MNERIHTPEEDEKSLYTERFEKIAKSFKRKGLLVVAIDILLTVIIAIAYASGKSSSMDLTITIALLSVFTFPFIFSFLNKSSQLMSDIESNRVQIVTGEVLKIKEEQKGNKTFKLLIMDRAKILIDSRFCSDFKENDRIRIIRGVSSKVPVLAEKDQEDN
ncbi:MAG TPA: hypothetical protein PKX79_12140 [Spirochaetota bacterium]|mgnify:CR=1 FL=1|jgi:hypothetical protein|nr:hypothetical protein [Spirochaetota bacterium]OQA99016.1 MAG: hypothetical protein BWY23_00764 [Spirochaetes bacterium ADurb.Bin218]HOK03279.1 hypothetical protein [Spirochaetota bacterium]HOK93446.1 hypothetical protein [Spirochaetota bacterium]HON16658.1 hypothetical protein [Spirochaetota bacterium]